jgi:hypothetical protein
MLKGEVNNMTIPIVNRYEHGYNKRYNLILG